MKKRRTSTSQDGESIDFSGFSSSKSDEETRFENKPNTRHDYPKHVLNKLKNSRGGVKLSVYEKRCINKLLESKIGKITTSPFKSLNLGERQLDVDALKQTLLQCNRQKFTSVAYMWAYIVNVIDSWIDEQNDMTAEDILNDANVTAEFIKYILKLVYSTCQYLKVYDDFWTSFVHRIQLQIYVNVDMEMYSEILKKEPIYFLVTDTFLGESIHANHSTISFRGRQHSHHEEQEDVTKKRQCIMLVNLNLMRNLLARYLNVAQFSTVNINSGLYSISKYENDNYSLLHEKKILTRLFLLALFHSLGHAEAFLNYNSCGYDHPTARKIELHDFNCIFV
jgi:hypothetical protein